MFQILSVPNHMIIIFFLPESAGFTEDLVRLFGCMRLP